jgi:hypothetical protein
MKNESNVIQTFQNKPNFTQVGIAPSETSNPNTMKIGGGISSRTDKIPMGMREMENSMNDGQMIVDGMSQNHEEEEKV